MIKLTFTPDIVAPGDLAPGSLTLVIRKLHAHVPIKEVFVDWKLTPLPTHYFYRITTDEIVPRLWKQNLYPNADPNEVGMTFDVTDTWKYHEFLPHREVRDTVLAIVRAYPALQTIKYEVV